MERVITVFEEDYDSVAIFNGELETIVERIRREATATVFDMGVAEDRIGAASMAHKVAKSKVALDKLGKELVSDWKSKAKLVDNDRKTLRDTLDDLRDEIRAPLTKWEADEEAKEVARALADQIADNHTEAMQLDDLFNREREIARKEKVFAEQQAERDRIEKEREVEAAQAAEQERQIEQARLQVQQAVQQSINEKEAEHKRIISEAKAESQRKIDDAQREAAQAVENANIEAERKLQAERDEEAARQRQALAEAQTLSNKRKTNKAAKEAFMDGGFEEDQAEKAVKLIANGRIPGITISYRGAP